MSKIKFEINFRDVDLESLETDEDFLAQAKKMLPKTLEKIGESIGEIGWAETLKLMKGMSRSTRGSGLTITPSNSPSDKRKFIANAKRDYPREVSSSDKKQILDSIVSQLKEGKATNQE